MTHYPATPSSPGGDLEMIVHDRIGYRRHLSRFQWDAILAVKREMPPAIFYAALDRLTPDTRDPATYLRAVCRKMKEAAEKNAGKRSSGCPLCGAVLYLDDTDNLPRCSKCTWSAAPRNTTVSGD